jgi:hypothetical protein
MACKIFDAGWMFEAKRMKFKDKNGDGKGNVLRMSSGQLRRLEGWTRRQMVSNEERMR